MSIVKIEQPNRIVLYFKQFEEKGKTPKEQEVIPFDRFSPAYSIIIKTHEE